MERLIRIELVGNFSQEVCDALVANSRFTLNHQAIFKPIPSELPDLIILNFGDECQESLNALNTLSLENRPILLAVLPKEDGQLLRKAMHAGARDYLVQPLTLEPLLNMIESLLIEKESRKQQAPGKITAVFSTSSNADAAFISGNLAHISAELGEQNTILLDLDLQFGSLPIMFDLAPERSFLEAMEAIDTLDEVAINAFCTKHLSGMRLMAALSDEIALPGEIASNHARQIIGMAARSSQNLFINLPRSIDPLTTQVMEEADNIVICVQQSFGSLNFARGLLKILLQELEIPTQKITLLLNRYQKKSRLSLQDIEQTLELKNIKILPADNKQVTEAGQYNLLLLDTARQSNTTKEMTQLLEELGAMHLPEQKSVLSKWFGRSEVKHK